MKLFTRIFFFTSIVITVAMAVLSCFLISHSFNNAMTVEISGAQDEADMLRTTFFTGLNSMGKADKNALSVLAQRLQKLNPEGRCMALFDENGECIFSGFAEMTVPDDMEDENGFSTIKIINGEYTICTQYSFTYNDSRYILVTSHNMQRIVDEAKSLCNTYIKLYMVMLAVSLGIILVMSFMISKPIGKLSAATEKIAGGNYTERVNVVTGDEIGALAGSFNTMADEVEKHIEMLKDEAKRREDFTAAFAHEMKTPLTSVIGYADMICRGNMDAQEVVSSAEFIRNEGMRLESLSHKMMELTVSRKHDFTLVETAVSELTDDLRDTLSVVLEKFGAEAVYDTESDYVMIEPDLMKTLLINLVDNALKAEAKTITVTGRVREDGYVLTVSDNGRGIPKEDINRITEAFYMVDKSRSRKQHGAGLGLSIAQAIAEVHGTRLEFESEVGVGTSVSIVLKKAVTE